MKKTTKISLSFLLLILLVGWVNVSADETSSNVIEPAHLELTQEEVLIKQNSKYDTHNLVVSGSYDVLEYPILDTQEVGKQTVIFKAKKGHTSIKKSIDVEIVPSQGPSIEGPESVELALNSDFEIETDYKAVDAQGNTVAVTIDGNLDRSIPGEYKLVVKAVDSVGNESKKNIKVIILEEEKQDEFEGLINEALLLNNTIFDETNVEEIEAMIAQLVAINLTENEEVTGLIVELESKLERAIDYYASQEEDVDTPTPEVEPELTPVVEPEPTPVVEPEPAPVVEPAPAPVVEPEPEVVIPSGDQFNATLTRYGMDCVGCVVTDGVAYTSHGIALTATAVRQPNGVWQDGITYNGRYIFAGNRERVKCTLLSLYDHPYEGRGIQQGVPIHGFIGDNGAFGYNHLDLFVGTETNIDAVYVVQTATQPYAIITGFGTFTGSGCDF